MAMFVQGEIIELQGIPGVYHELKFRLPDEQVLPLFYSYPQEERAVNPHDPISALLEPGQAYELLIIVRAEKIKYAPEIPLGTVFEVVVVAKEFVSKTGSRMVKRNEILQGKVLDPDWNPHSQQYRAVYTPKMYKRRYMLMDIGIGKAVLSRIALEEMLGEQVVEQITAGGYLEWSPARLDILAIL